MDQYRDEAERLIKARSGLILGSPFFGSLALRLDMKIDPKAETAFWVDGKTVGVRPEAAKDMPLDELEGMLARATLHCALGHTFRRGGRDAKRWGTAAGHVANLEVLASGMRLPQGSPADNAYKGMTPEEVYAATEPPPSPDGSGGQQDGPQGQQGQSPGKPQSGSGAPQPPQGSQAPGQVENGSEDASDGSGAPDTGQPPEMGSGEVRDAPGDASEMEAQVSDWQEAVAQATQLARNAGKLPGSLERAAQQVLSPQVGWREALMRFFKSRAKDDHSWTTPSRRFLHLGYYLPAMQSVRMGTIGVAVDLSASIKQKWIDAFFAEMQSVREECNPERIIVIPFDSRVRAEAVKDIGEYEEMELRAKAGGGTDFEPVVKYLAEQQIEPDVLIYLTDLDCDSFAEEPSYPVLWASTSSRTKVPYGEVVRLIV